MSKPLIQLSADLKKLGESLHQTANKIKRETARQTFHKICKKSPILMGDYLKSNRIGILKTEGGRGVGKGAVQSMSLIEKSAWMAGKEYPESVKEAMREAHYQSKKAYISSAQPKDSIVISNNISYADRVEYVGWATQPAYHVYGLTVEEMNIMFPLIMKAFGIKR